VANIPWCWLLGLVNVSFLPYFLSFLLFIPLPFLLAFVTIVAD
jgi:hypothetical protein